MIIFDDIDFKHLFIHTVNKEIPSFKGLLPDLDSDNFSVLKIYGRDNEPEQFEKYLEQYKKQGVEGEELLFVLFGYSRKVILTD